LHYSPNAGLGGDDVMNSKEESAQLYNSQMKNKPFLPAYCCGCMFRVLHECKRYGPIRLGAASWSQRKHNNFLTFVYLAA